MKSFNIIASAFFCVLISNLAIANEINASINIIPHTNNSYYVKQINGPKYQIIAIANNSNSSTTLSPITLPDSVKVENNISYYGNHTKCNIDGTQTLNANSSCIIILKADKKELGTNLNNIIISLNSPNASNSITKSITLKSSYAMYVSGMFYSIGGVSINTNERGYGTCGAGDAKTNDMPCLLAKYDGTNWSNVNAPRQSADGLIYSLAFDNAGNLYTGGLFSSIGNISIANTTTGQCGAAGSSACLLAKFDGHTWSKVFNQDAENPSNDIFEIAFDKNDNLYITGEFKHIGGVSIPSGKLLAKYDGNNWTNAITSGQNPDHAIYSIAFDQDNNMYAGGEFTQIANLSTPNKTMIAKFNNGTWSEVASQNNGQGIYNITVDQNNNLIVGGTFTQLGNASADNSETPSINSCGINDNKACLLATYNNGSWNNLLTNNNQNANNWIRAIAFDNSNNMYIGGWFQTIGGAALQNNNYLLAKYDGSNFSKVIDDDNQNANQTILAIAFGESLQATVNFGE